MSTHVSHSVAEPDENPNARCTVDLSKGAVTCAGGVRLEGGECVVSVSVVGDAQQVPTLPSALGFRLERAERLAVRVGGEEWLLETEKPGDWPLFLSAHLPSFLDLVLSRFLPEGADDVIWVERESPGEVWCLMLKAAGPGWGGALALRGRPPAVDTSFTITNGEEQRDEIRGAYDLLREWLPQGFFVAPSARGGRKALTAKIHPAELWFVRFPLTVFGQFRYEGFERYAAVEWVVTNKGFICQALERELIRGEVTDAARLLSGAVVVINTYREHRDQPLSLVGTRLCLELLSLFRDVEFSGDRVSLRWYLNPDAESLSRQLSDRQTAYFFADFEASKGQWELGDGPRASWDDCPTGLAASRGEPAVADGAEREVFSLDGGRLDLSHVRLMRVFHCNTVFDPFQASVDGRDPADHRSLVRRLLDSGVLRVEGGMTEEEYCDYLCALIELLCDPPQFRFILKLKCWEAGQDFGHLVSRLDAFRAAVRGDLPLDQLTLLTKGETRP